MEEIVQTVRRSVVTQRCCRVNCFEKTEVEIFMRSRSCVGHIRTKIIPPNKLWRRQPIPNFTENFQVHEEETHRCEDTTSPLCLRFIYFIEGNPKAQWKCKGTETRRLLVIRDFLSIRYFWLPCVPYWYIHTYIHTYIRSVRQARQSAKARFLWTLQ